MALASFVFGTTSGYSLLVVLVDDILDAEVPSAFQRAT